MTVININLDQGFTLSTNTSGLFNNQASDSYIISYQNSNTVKTTLLIGSLYTINLNQGNGIAQVDLPPGVYSFIITSVMSLNISMVMTKVGYSIGPILAANHSFGTLIDGQVLTAGLCYGGLSPKLFNPIGIYHGQMSITSLSLNTRFKLCLGLPDSDIAHIDKDKLTATINIRSINDYLDINNWLLTDIDKVFIKYRITDTITNESRLGYITLKYDKDYDILSELIEQHGNISDEDLINISLANIELPELVNEESIFDKDNRPLFASTMHLGHKIKTSYLKLQTGQVVNYDSSLTEGLLLDIDTNTGNRYFITHDRSRIVYQWLDYDNILELK